MHVGEVWRLRAEASPDGPCVEDDRVRRTSGEFAAAVERLSGGLASLGVGAGDIVATMLPNCVEMVLTLFAAWRMGVAVTPVNPALATGAPLPGHRAERRRWPCTCAISCRVALASWNFASERLSAAAACTFCPTMITDSTSCRKVCATQETIAAGPQRIASGRLIRSNSANA